MLVVPATAAHLAGEAGLGNTPQPVVPIRYVLAKSGIRHRVIALGAAVLTAVMVLLAFVGAGTATDHTTTLPGRTFVAGKLVPATESGDPGLQ